MPLSIEFSDHFSSKIEILKRHGIVLSEELIRDVINFPDKIEKGYNNRLIVQKSLDKEHVLRVVYEIKSDKILVITVYPGRRSRYEKD